MLEIKANGSLDERRYSSLGPKPCEEALIERIADAMLDYNSVNSEEKFTLSSSPKRKTLISKPGRLAENFSLTLLELAMCCYHTSITLKTGVFQPFCVF